MDSSESHSSNFLLLVSGIGDQNQKQYVDIIDRKKIIIKLIYEYNFQRFIMKENKWLHFLF